MFTLIIEDLGITKKRLLIGVAMTTAAGILVGLGGSSVVYTLTGAACGYLFATLVHKSNQ